MMNNTRTQRAVSPPSAVADWPMSEDSLGAGQDSARAQLLAALDGRSRELLVRDGVKALASEWGLPARTLRRLCAERHVNLSACRRVFKRELARELLRSREPLGQVAQALGFASTQTLARYVRTEFGCTATELRRALPFFGPSRTL